MFHWICPECGREIAPTVRECPVCDPAGNQSEPVHAGDVEAPARTIKREPVGRDFGTATRRPIEPAPAPRGYDAWTAAAKEITFHENGAAATPQAEAGLQSGGSQSLQSAVELKPRRIPWGQIRALRLRKPADPGLPSANSATAAPADAPGVSGASKNVIQDTLALPAFAGNELAGRVITHDPHSATALPEPPLQPAPFGSEALVDETAPEPHAPEPILPSLVPENDTNSLDSLVAVLGLIDAEAERGAGPQECLAESAPESESPQASGPSTSEQPEVEANEPDPPASPKIPLAVRPIPPALNALILSLRPSMVRPAPKPVIGGANAQASAPAVPDVQPPIRIPILPVPAQQEVSQNAAVTDLKEIPAPAPQARQVEHAVPLPAPAPAPLLPYSPLSGRPLRPAIPALPIVKSECAPRITLPGPMLSPRLVSFDERDVRPVFPEARKYYKRSIPAWLVVALVLGTVLAAGFNTLFSVVPRRSTEVIAEAAQPSARASGVASNSLARTIEIAGIRVLVDASRKSQIQYLVVNHSSERFSDATVYVTLRASDAKPGEAPLCRFSFRAPDLGPYESREMVAEIEKLNRPVAVPDWQDLHAEVELAP